MLTSGDGRMDGSREPDRMLRDLSVPLSSMVSTNDLAEARRILEVHYSQATVRRVCGECGATWPCADAIYALLVTGGPLTGDERTGR